MKVEDFLKDYNPTAEELASVSTFFSTPERQKRFADSMKGLSEVSTREAALTKAQADLEAHRKRFDAELTEWATLTSAEKAANTQLRESLEKLQARELALTQRVQRVAIDAGLDPAKALEGIDQTPPKKEEPPPAVDPSKFVGAEQFGEFGNWMFGYATALPAIVSKHKALFGTDLDTTEFGKKIQERAKQRGANLDPMTVWQESYNVSTRQAEVDKTQREAELKTAREEGRRQALSEASLPVPPSTGKHSPLFRTGDGQPRQSVLNRPQPEGAVARAVAAFDSAKYKPADPVGAR